MSPAEALKIARAVDQFAHTATTALAQRWTHEGASAPTYAPNPYREGSYAATCWQRGHDTQDPEAQP